MLLILTSYIPDVYGQCGYFVEGNQAFVMDYCNELSESAVDGVDENSSKFTCVDGDKLYQYWGDNLKCEGKIYKINLICFIHITYKH